ncbi:MAG: dehypoxanthine futalosine cyclase [Chloroflexi bacterium]|nr:dehypoxanthine futalosine cyclase [Chloroflexota bacterium]MCI0579149.1 dehypoxanthine futalosine cyclase [Chloroflexota bacterium]MCI0643659.1 dehypoxanthine futalosine cyclase [Chloroflexota bacterium]MCI0726523.1 dehypoxanthine futalosine cyclase [Chloroflexota bacterium]
MSKLNGGHNGLYRPHRTFASDRDGFYKGDSAGLHGLTSVPDILAKVEDGGRITYDEAMVLYTQADLLQLGRAANARRQQLAPGEVVTYLIDRNINYTNVCHTDCSFCAFYRHDPNHPEAYVNPKPVIGKKIEETLYLGGTRILMQGGHNDELPWEYYFDLVSWIHQTYPAIEINAFSPSEIDQMVSVSGLGRYEVLKALQAAGLKGLPGGGGEILDDEVRKRVSPKKQRSDGWLDCMHQAHKLGLTTTATMVIGFREEVRHRLNHLQRLRDLQDASLRDFGTGFNAFISWTVQIENTPLERSRFAPEYGATPHEYLRHTAVARIFLDNIAHHQASWPTQGEKVAAVALHMGCDDFGSTMIEENVVSAAGARTAVKCLMSVPEIHRQIRDAGFIPAQRDSSYRIVRQYTADETADAALLPPTELAGPATGNLTNSLRLTVLN